MRSLVLIETLWNVKTNALKFLFSFAASINRNIVECKVILFRHMQKGEVVLIETLWNVKVFFHIHGASSPRINRNIVECKGEFRTRLP